MRSVVDLFEEQRFVVGAGMLLVLAGVGIGCSQEKFVVLGASYNLGRLQKSQVVEVPLSILTLTSGRHALAPSLSGGCCSKKLDPAVRDGIGVLRTTYRFNTESKEKGYQEEQIAITVTSNNIPKTRLVRLKYEVLP